MKTQKIWKKYTADKIKMKIKTSTKTQRHTYKKSEENDGMYQSETKMRLIRCLQEP